MEFPLNAFSCTSFTYVNRHPAPPEATVPPQLPVSRPTLPLRYFVASIFTHYENVNTAIECFRVHRRSTNLFFLLGSTGYAICRSLFIPSGNFSSFLVLLERRKGIETVYQTKRIDDRVFSRPSDLNMWNIHKLQPIKKVVRQSTKT